MMDERFKGALVWLAGLVLVAIYFSVFMRFFPNAAGYMGHDYAYFFPQLLDGYFWQHQNGFLTPQWATPAFCGGLPKFPNPQALSYSLPQLATVLTGPMSGIRITFVVCAGLGFWGSYLLLRSGFATGRAAALLGATFFLWNTLFSARMLIGHLTFHSFMLVPFLAWFVLRSAHGPTKMWRTAIDICGGALIIAYMATTSLAHVLLPALAAVALIALMRSSAAMRPGGVMLDFGRLALSGILALGLSAAKLNAMYSLLSLFPRTLYPLPGVPDLGKLMVLVFQLLFFPVPQSGTHELVVNSRWTLATHEFEFGVGFVPLWVIAIAGAFILNAMRKSDLRPSWPISRILALIGVFVLISIPILVNYYSPDWNAFLKSLPFIGSGSTQLRWLALYILPVVVLAAVGLDRAADLREYMTLICVIGIAATLWLGWSANRAFYERQGYDPSSVLAAYSAVEEGLQTPRIERVVASLGKDGKERMLSQNNDALARGESVLNCYETLVGFRLELFPRGDLHTGAALEENGDHFNLKDPSCYVFPEENGCEPGAHFATSRRAAANAFLSYRPFEHRVSKAQRVASWVTMGSLAAVTLCIISCILIGTLGGGRRRAAGEVERDRHP